MQKYLFVLTCASILIMPIISVSADSGNNTSYINNGPTYQSVKENLRGFIMAKQMEENATKFELANMEKYKEFYHEFIKTHPFQDVASTSNWAKEKVQLAKQQSGYALWDYRTNYDMDVQFEKADILKQLHDYLSNGRNGIPAFVNCEASHNCSIKPFIPVVTEQQQNEVLANSTLGNYSIPLKPEFANNPSGFIDSPTWIKNMTDLQKFMGNSTK